MGKGYRSREEELHPTERRLRKYAITAGAALVAGVPSADAASITRIVNLPIPAGNPGAPVMLDVDNNGVNDFVFFNNIGDSVTPGILGVVGEPPANGVFGYGITVDPVPGGIGLVAPKGSFLWPDDIPATGPVGLQKYAKIGFASASSGGFATTKGKSPDAAYPLPLAFDIGGSTHYGWARISATLAAPYTLDAYIRDVGWETTPGAAVHVPNPIPEPNTLGMLALGAVGILALRRKTRKGE